MEKASRRPLFSFHGYCLRWVAWVSFAILLVLSGLHQQSAVLAWPHLSAPLMPDDSDVWLRLSQAREWITGNAGFFDHRVLRTNAPFGGVSIHWTRPVDMVLAALYHLAPTGFSTNTRMMLAATWMPVMLSFVIVVLIANAASRRMRHSYTVFSAVLLSVFSPLKYDYLQPGNADHHGLLCALWCGVLYILMEELDGLTAAIAGLLLGCMIWIDLEAFIPMAGVLAALGVLALENTARMKPLAVMISAIFITVFAALFIEMPASDVFHRVTYDSLSIVHVFLMGIVAVGAWALVPLYRFLAGWKTRVAAAGAAAASAGLSMAFVFPKFFAGPMVDMPPYIIHSFLPGISEMNPIYLVSIEAAAATLAAPLLAITLAGMSLHRRMNSKKRRQMLILLSLLTMTLFCVLLHVRWTYYLQPIALIVASGLLPGLCRARRHELFKCVAVLPDVLRCAAIILIVPFSVFVAQRVSATDNYAATAASGDCIRQSEYVLETGQVQKLIGEKPLILMTEKDLGGWVQFFTPYSVIAQNYHREGAGMQALVQITQQKTMAAARTLMHERHIGAVLVCPSIYPPDSWVHGLEASSRHYPSWLTTVTGLRFSGTSAETPLLFIAQP